MSVPRVSGLQVGVLVIPCAATSSPANAAELGAIVIVQCFGCVLMCSLCALLNGLSFTRSGKCSASTGRFCALLVPGPGSSRI